MNSLLSHLWVHKTKPRSKLVVDSTEAGRWITGNSGILSNAWSHPSIIPDTEAITRAARISQCNLCSHLWKPETPRKWHNHLVPRLYSSLECIPRNNHQYAGGTTATTDTSLVTTGSQSKPPDQPTGIHLLPLLVWRNQICKDTKTAASKTSHA